MTPCYLGPVSTRAIVCPSCHAPGATGPDASDQYRCSYCGTSFTQAPGPSTPAPIVVNVQGQGPGSNSAVVVLAVASVLLVAVGAVGALIAGRGESTSDGSGPAATATATARAPSRPSGASINAPVRSASVEAKAEVKAPATASFEFQHRQSGYQSSFYALGFVTNTSPYTIEKPKITAVLLDGAGAELGTANGFGERDVLAPEERSPVKILIKDPPDHASMRFEVVAREARYAPKLIEGLRVEAREPKQARFGDDRWELEGKAFNDGDAGAKFVKVEIQALDASGRLVGLGSSFADAEVLAPGAEARWSTSMAVAEAPDHFSFSVSGRAAN